MVTTGYLTWKEAKDERLLVNSNCNLTPIDEMFLADGCLISTKCYNPLDRSQSACIYQPIRYGLDYVLDCYESRVIKRLSEDNKAKVECLILDEGIKTVSIDCSNACKNHRNYTGLTVEDQRAWAKYLASQLGLRLIKK